MYMYEATDIFFFVSFLFGNFDYYVCLRLKKVYEYNLLCMRLLNRILWKTIFVNVIFSHRETLCRL